jgi:biotin carboxylase
MINEGEVKGKKLLIVGGIPMMADLVSLAHRNGVFVGVADYNENTYLKKIADANHSVSATDVDAIVRLVKDEHYDGIISQFNDMLLPYIAKEAEALDMWVPYNEENVKMSTDKIYFKKKCIEYGLPVPKEYEINNKDDIDKKDIEYPVIIKPADSSGSRGVMACHDKEELIKGYDNASEVSLTGRVIVEQYLPYDEINMTYIIQNGVVQLAAIHDRYFNDLQDSFKIPDLYIYPSRYTNLILERYNKDIIMMLEGIGLKNGSLFIQAIVKDDKLYLYEAGMRLNGCKTYQILEVENDYNTFEHLMNYALTGCMGEFQKFNPKFKRWYATWCVVTKTDVEISGFKGENKLDSYPWLIYNDKRYYEGESIPQNFKGTLGQLSSRMHIYGNTKDQLIEHLQKVFETYKVVDKHGESILLPTHDIEEIRSSLDYEL